MKEIDEKIDYLFSKINWKDSFLDARAIQIMNNLSKDIREKIESSSKFIKHIQNHLQHGEKVICKICGKTVDEIEKE